MSPRRLTRIFEQFFELPPDERESFLDDACGGDPAFRRKADALIEAAGKSSGFLVPPGVDRELPASIGKYRIVRELGRGAMGVVYLAEDPELQRRVAIKTLVGALTGNPTYRAHLRKEALALAALTQPNIAQVYTLEGIDTKSEESAHAFITMEYVPGTTLAERRMSPSFSLETALDFGRQICSALESAHERGIVHRDLKPLNVRVTPDGWAKVLDFGLAQAAGSVRPMHGTLGYMSPEQLEGGEVDTRSDLWSLGCILFECLGRERAFTGGPAELVEKTKTGTIDWTSIGSDVPISVVHVLRRCLSVDVGDRPAVATDVRRVLEDELLRLRSAPFVGTAGRQLLPADTGNLPSLPGRYVGRETLLARLVEITRGTRLVSLVGMGGAGKTRTALELAHRIENRFPDGAWLVELAEIDDAAAIPAHVARALDLRSGKEADFTRLVEEALQDRSLLLVLDNCEHLVEGAARFVKGLLASCPHVEIVVTSREPLGLAGEQSHPLPPLDVPVETMVPEQARLVESVTLFEARARARDPEFELDERSTQIVAELCRVLDGLPLAIELAAGHVRTLALDEMLARVREDRRFLGDRDLTRTERHRSLHGLVDWSYQLLSSDEQSLLDRLSLFRGSWSLATAESVCADETLPNWMIYGALGRLVEKSLVEVESFGDAIRYRLLETVRHFALERLKVRERRDEELPRRLRERFVEVSIALSTPMESEQGLNDAGWLRRMRLEYGNLSQALEAALEDGRIDLAMHLCLHLARYWGHEGRWRKGIEMIERVLTSDARPTSGVGDESNPHLGHPRTGTPRSDPIHRVGVLTHAAEIAANLDEFEKADAFVEEGLALAERCGDDRARSRMFGAAGIVAFYKVQLLESDRLFGECERLGRGVGDRAGLARCLADRGRVRSVSGRHDEAQPLYQESLRLSRELGDQLSGARVLVNLGRTARMLGRDEEAAVLIEKSLQIHRDAHDLPGVALCLQNMAEVAWSLDRDLEKAREFLRESLRIRYRAGQKNTVYSILIDFARMEGEAGNPTLAAQLVGGILEAYRAQGLFLYDGIRERIEGIERSLEEQIGEDPARIAREAGERMTVRDLVRLVETGEVGPMGTIGS